VADFAASIPRMTAEELEENLARYGGDDEGWAMLQAMTTLVDDEKAVH
jgi:hypothetical protein